MIIFRSATTCAKMNDILARSDWFLLQWGQLIHPITQQFHHGQCEFQKSPCKNWSCSKTEDTHQDIFAT